LCRAMDGTEEILKIVFNEDDEKYLMDK
jgi:hypothetical protein